MYRGGQLKAQANADLVRNPVASIRRGAARPFVEPITETTDDLVKQHLRSSRMFADFQTNRDELIRRHKGNAKISVEKVEGIGLNLVAEVSIPTKDDGLSDNVLNAVSGLGLSLKLRKGVDILERVDNPSARPGDTGVFRKVRSNIYVIYACEGSKSSLVDNITATTKALLDLSDIVPAIMKEESDRRRYVRARGALLTLGISEGFEFSLGISGDQQTKRVVAELTFKTHFDPKSENQPACEEAVKLAKNLGFDLKTTEKGAERIYLLSLSEGSELSRPENLAQTSEGLLRLAKEIPIMLR